MTAVALPEVAARPAPVLSAFRFELLKLLSQWRVRILLAACWVGPGAFVAVVSRQSALPSDTVFGRLMNASGWAGALVVLAFGCSWALPLLTALVAGDVFAVEDRLGTWRHLLVAVRSKRRIFAAKALASVGVILLLVAGLATSSLVGGLASAGDRPLSGLDGHGFSGSQVAGRFLLAWLCVLAPTLAFAAVGLLGSVALGRSPMGLVLPAVLAVGLALVEMLPLPLVVRLALPSQAFIAWRGLFTEEAQAGPLVIGVLVALAWAVVATAAAHRLFLRRDFTDLANDGSGTRVVLAGLLPLAVLTALSVVVVAVATPATGSGIDRAKLEGSLATSYGHLYRLQTEQLNRPPVTEAQLQTTVACDKGGSLVTDDGPGTDWRCVVSWHLPGATAVGSATYQLDVTADGRYVADGDGPQEVNGFFQVQAPHGIAPNPLWQFDGSVDLLSPPRKD
ncbi:ABC-2 type transport system permease protein [Friedmanniella luteola]|uniref:ABC-2 type transport system permease protein n=1 Tax=Friedmanniella luteola TaxID=546871 RepID=A0A1H1MS78_9ACTN|nr:ABC transporter permease [Friedmanniella luteola]SDR89547.1 ABC-2 type transport system permease protein [Friedmanniella luteola]